PGAAEGRGAGGRARGRDPRTRGAAGGAASPAVGRSEPVPRHRRGGDRRRRNREGAGLVGTRSPARLTAKPWTSGAGVASLVAGYQVEYEETGRSGRRVAAGGGRPEGAARGDHDRSRAASAAGAPLAAPLRSLQRGLQRRRAEGGGEDLGRPDGRAAAHEGLAAGGARGARAATGRAGRTGARNRLIPGHVQVLNRERGSRWRDRRRTGRGSTGRCGTRACAGPLRTRLRSTTSRRHSPSGTRLDTPTLA